MTNVCLIVRALPIHRQGGLEYHTLDLANALAGLGHRISIVTTRHPQGLLDEQLPSGVRVQYLPVGVPANYSLAWWRALPQAIRTLDVRERFDLIHAQDFAGMFLGGARCPVVSTIHGTMTSETPLDRRYMRRLSVLDKVRAVCRYPSRIALMPMFRHMLLRADALIVDSEYTFRELVRQNRVLREKTSVIPLGIDWSRYGAVPAPPEREGPLGIALLGRLQEMKGIGVALDAASVLAQRGADFRMRIGGAGEYAPVLKQRIASDLLKNRVTYHGRIPDEELAGFLGSNDVFLFPDLTQPAFGLVAVEAMRCGLPVVAARSGAIPEVVTPEVGWLYEPWNVHELANVLERLCADHSLAADRRQAAATRAAGFTAGKMATGVAEVYDRLIKQRKQRR